MNPSERSLFIRACATNLFANKRRVARLYCIKINLNARCASGIVEVGTRVGGCIRRYGDPLRYKDVVDSSTQPHSARPNPPLTRAPFISRSLD